MWFHLCSDGSQVTENTFLVIIFYIHIYFKTPNKTHVCLSDSIHRRKLSLWFNSSRLRLQSYAEAEHQVLSLWESNAALSSAYDIMKSSSLVFPVSPFKV